MVGTGRFELPTSPTRKERSTKLSHVPTREHRIPGARGYNQPVDLGKCPRCGTEWVVGAEICGTCGFVPIGAGLKAAPKEPETVAAPAPKRFDIHDVHPSSTGYVLLLIAFLTLAFGVELRPWKNGWEGLRIAFGDVSSSEAIGRWIISRSVTLDAQGLPGEQRLPLSGEIVLRSNARASVILQRGGVRARAEGRFTQHGQTVEIDDLRMTIGDRDMIPSKFTLELTWQDASNVIAEVDSREVLYLRRKADHER